MQADVKKYLSAWCQNGTLPHALLFVRTNNLDEARAIDNFAKVLLCEHSDKVSLSPCGICPNCHLLQAQHHSDYQVIKANGKKISIDEVRPLNHWASKTASHGLNKVVLIDGLETLTLQASNALLKLLEEPPANVYFLLSTKAINLLLPTILSRCIKLAFHPAAFDASLSSSLQDRLAGELGHFSYLKLNGFKKSFADIPSIELCQAWQILWTDLTKAKIYGPKSKQVFNNTLYKNLQRVPIAKFWNFWDTLSVWQGKLQTVNQLNQELALESVMQAFLQIFMAS